MRERLVAAFVSLAVALVAFYAIPRSYDIAADIRAAENRKIERSIDLMALLLPEHDESGTITDAYLAGLLNQEERLEYTAADGSLVAAAGAALPELPSNIVMSRTLPDGSAITLARSGDFVEARVTRELTDLAVLGLGLLAVAVAAGLVMARFMARPFLELARLAKRLGSGGFEDRIPRFRVPEADGIGRALQSSSLALKDMLRREREFASNASHQLRTPLTALRLEIEDLTLRRDTPPGIAEDLGRALREVDRLNQAVSDLLDLARNQRMAAGTGTDLAEIAAGAVTRWRPAAAGQGRLLEARLPDSLPAPVPKGPVQQILDVLIDNALKHGQGTVTVRAADAGTHLSLTVADAGPRPAGDIFHRHVTDGTGEGIGLALAGELAESIGCHLGLATARKTSFILKLPIPVPARTASSAGQELTIS
ncbi:sensor histidine kinase [Arthrobacter mangrovi]|uniref:histidine kinase n=1 Tax=Arthrobacter mangrovi TaxID=2966350 RepID=A0ABQ5MXL0_9MICC|nr:HAMP domain-containing sensor histidine kinase [Arthrobacter mangrovi]GLB68735.1 two-component sensor histidine kinase [Arthrobacter mangrovi]